MLHEQRVGAHTILVAYDQDDAQWLTKLLRRIDPALHLEQQLTVEDERVWCVVEDTHRDTGDRFVTVFEWRDGLGRPIPVPTSGIIAEFERRRHEREQGLGLRELGQQAEARNAARRQRMDEDRAQASEDRLRDFERYVRKSDVRWSHVNEVARRIVTA